MKTTIVRASVLALAFVGFTASSVMSYSQKTAHQVGARKGIVPAPLCSPWNDPTCCGMH
jgi:hypothetical protein